MKKHYLLLLSFLFFIPPVLAQDIFTNISNAYADLEMQSDIKSQKDRYQCENQECVNDMRFEQKVSEIGQKLSIAAFDLYPALDKRINYFQFTVADKDAYGTASNAEGHIVIYRGVQDLMLTDDALSFVLAREMAHVIAKHHHKDHSTKLIFSALATVIFPAAGILEASASLLETSAISSLASNLSAEVAIVNAKPYQRKEADQIALNLNQATNHSAQAIARTLPLGLETKNVAWLKHLGESKLHLQQSVQQPKYEIANARHQQPKHHHR